MGSIEHEPLISRTTSSVFKQTQNGLFDQAAGSGKGGRDGIAELLTEFRRSGADGQKKSIAGQGIVEFPCQGEQLRRALMMGGKSLLCRGRLDWGQRDRPRSGIDRAVEEEHGLGAGNLFGEFGCPLLAGKNAETGF